MSSAIKIRYPAPCSTEHSASNVRSLNIKFQTLNVSARYRNVVACLFMTYVIVRPSHTRHVLGYLLGKTWWN